MARDNKELRRMMIQSAVRASKEIAELPKNGNWAYDEKYVQTVAEHVLEICERYGMLPTVAHIASAIGITKDTEADIRTGVIRNVSPDVAAVFRWYYSICENTTVASTLDGGSNNIAGIFLLKSQYGYKEEPREVVFTHNKLLGERKDPAAIAARYAEAIVVDKDGTRPADGEARELPGEFEF